MMTGFSNEQIVSFLGTHSLWCKKACREILARKDEFVPLLLDILDKAIAEKDPYNLTDTDIITTVSMLLAQMRVTEAYPRLIALFSYDEGRIYYIWDDLLCEIGPSMLRDTYNGNPALLPAFIENRAVSPFARIMAIDAYDTHHEDGHISREEVVAFFRRLAYDVYAGKAKNNDKIVLAGLCSVVVNHHLSELLDDVKNLYKRNAVDESFFGDFESFLTYFNDPKYREKFCHVDVINDLGEWGWFREDYWVDEYDDDFDE